MAAEVQTKPAPATADEDSPAAVTNVVIGVDGSDHSDHAFDWYLSHLHRKGNFLHLVHSLEMPSVGSFIGYRPETAHVPVEVWHAMVEREREKWTSLEEKYKVKLKQMKIPGKFVTCSHLNPGEAVVKVAGDIKADMIIMGTRGLGTIRRTILGSVSDFVVHHAHCPVVVCRQ